MALLYILYIAAGLIAASWGTHLPSHKRQRVDRPWFGQKASTFLPATTPATPLTLYHYTTEKGKTSIENEGIIRESTGRYLANGTGVYLTSLPPSVGKEEVGATCYLGGSRHMVAAGRLDFAVEVDIPSREVKRFRDNCYLYKGDLRLANYKHSFIKVNF